MNLLISMLLTQPGEGGAAVTQAAAAATEAATQASSQSSGGFNGMWGMALYVIFFIAIFYLLIIRPQKKKDKQVKDMQAAIQVGDEIMTSSGFYGTVVDLKDDVATIEFGTNKGVRIPVKKSEIYGTNKTNSNDAEKSADKK